MVTNRDGGIDGGGSSGRMLSVQGQLYSYNVDDNDSRGIGYTSWPAENEDERFRQDPAVALSYILAVSQQLAHFAIKHDLDI
jgi:hypothetical protein